jgi:hypothetical protein
VDEMAKFYILVILMLSSSAAFSQKEAYNWLFGKSDGISFYPDGKEPKEIIPSLNLLSCTSEPAAISDSKGKLELFYIANEEGLYNNSGILNRFFQKIPNLDFVVSPTIDKSDNSLGGEHVYTYGIMIDAIFIKNPQSNSENTLFLIKGSNLLNKFGTQGIYKYTTNMKLDSGRGDLQNFDYVNSSSYTNNSEYFISLNAVNHKDNENYWLIANKKPEQFSRIYLIVIRLCKR